MVRFPGQPAITRELHALLLASGGQAEVQQHASAFPVLAEAGGQLNPQDVQFWAPTPLLQVLRLQMLAGLVTLQLCGAAVA